MKRKQSIAVDIDGVLCSGVPYSRSIPNWDNISIVNHLHDTFRIVLYTSRRKSDRYTTVKWLHDHHIEYDRLIMGKFRAAYYIDDKSTTLEELNRRGLTGNG